MLTKNLLYLVIAFVLAFNVVVRMLPRRFISLLIAAGGTMGPIRVVPASLYNYCDVYLLLIFIILIFFFVGTDYRNSMEEIALAVGGSSTNKFMLRKLSAVLLLHFALYIITFANIYTLYLGNLEENHRLIPLWEIMFFSITTNVFIISLSLFFNCSIQGHSSKYFHNHRLLSCRRSFVEMQNNPDQGHTGTYL